MRIIPRRPRRILGRIYRILTGAQNRYFETQLKQCTGLLHVGANVAQEAAAYDRMGLPVVWVEGLPDLAAQARITTAAYPNQIVLQTIVSDKSGETVTMRRANNNGASSSILNYVDEGGLWPEIEMVEELELQTDTIDGIMAKHPSAFSKIDACLLDIQGAEYLALKGATRFLRQVKLVSVETCEMELYEGGARPEALSEILTSAGFIETRRNYFAGNKKAGFCYDGIWERKSS